MTEFKKILSFAACFVFTAVCFSTTGSAQDRERVIRTNSSQPTNQPPATNPVERVQTTGSSRPTLTNDIRVSSRDAAWEPVVKNTTSARASSIGAIVAAGRSAYNIQTSSVMDHAIKSKYGIRYKYGTSGPNTYDCSGFVWSVFQEAGIPFTRVSARSLWAQSEPVTGDDRYKYGTLVFLNGLGHMGIVADENGFYHASSSRGITYSPFKGYWEKRIVGFRKLITENPTVE